VAHVRLAIFSLLIASLMWACDKDTPTKGVDPTASVVLDTISLDQNYPNPFTPSTSISFTLLEKSDYTLTIYDVKGDVVKVYSGTEEAGTYEVTWETGEILPGVYFYRLVAGDYSATKKLIVL
jgi:Secretion system C-terminal sorting domain